MTYTCSVLCFFLEEGVLTYGRIMTLFFNRHWCLISCCLDDVDVALEKNMDALIFPFNVEVVDYLMPEHLLEVFLFFISWPPKLRIPDIMICEQGFVFVAFLDITWIMDKCGQCGLVATLRLQTLKKPWYWGQIMVVDRFIRPCCLWKNDDTLEKIYVDVE